MLRCTAYEQKLAKFMLLISSLSGNCAWYVLEDMRRLLYMRNGKVSRSGNLASRKEACSSLARLACLRKSLAEVEDKGRRFASHSSLEALLDLEASLAGSLAYRSADGKHPAVYIPVASLSPTSLYLHVTPAEFQRTLLGLFDRAWEKLGATSRRHGEKISHGKSHIDLYIGYFPLEGPLVGLPVVISTIEDLTQSASSSAWQNELRKLIVG